MNPLDYLLATLYLVNNPIGELGAGPTPIRMYDKRGFYSCGLVQYKFRRDVDIKLDNILVVLEFLTHQNRLSLGKTVTLEIGAFEHKFKLRVVRLTKKKVGTAYTYVVQLQGNTHRILKRK